MTPERLKQGPLRGRTVSLVRRCILAELLGHLGPEQHQSRRLKKLWWSRSAELANQPVCTDRNWLAAARSCTPWTTAALKPSARFCHLSWACPYCYGRALAELWRQLPRSGFSLEVHAMPLLPFGIDQPWLDFTQQRRKLAATVPGAVAWQWLLPRREMLELRLVVASVGGQATEQDFVSAFAYPAGWLLGDARRAAYCFWYMRHKRGRASFGTLRENHVFARDDVE